MFSISVIMKKFVQTRLFYHLVQKEVTGLQYVETESKQ